MYCSSIFIFRTRLMTTERTFRRLCSSGDHRLANISKAWFKPLTERSEYLSPYRFYYIQDNCERMWDLVRIYDGLVTILYNKARQKLVFVKQFRPALYHAIVSEEMKPPSSAETLIDLKKYPPELGVSLELCAGLSDKNKSHVETIKEEVLEECGYNVPITDFERIISYRSDISTTCVKQILYYCEITDDQRVGPGGGIDDNEVIDVVELSLHEACQLVSYGSTTNFPPATVVGMMWFFANVANPHFK